MKMLVHDFFAKKIEEEIGGKCPNPECCSHKTGEAIQIKFTTPSRDFDCYSGYLDCKFCSKILMKMWDKLKESTLKDLIDREGFADVVYKDKRKNKLYSIRNFIGRGKFKIEYANNKIVVEKINAHLLDLVATTEFEERQYYNIFNDNDRFNILFYLGGSLLDSRANFVNFRDLKNPYHLMKIENQEKYIKYLKDLSTSNSLNAVGFISRFKGKFSKKNYQKFVDSRAPTEYEIRQNLKYQEILEECHGDEGLASFIMRD